MPELRLKRSWSFSILIGLLHGLVILSLLQLPDPFLWLAPFVVLSMLVAVAKYGLFCLSRSVERIWFTPDGWFLGLNNKVQMGPYRLDGATRLDRYYVRLSLRQSNWRRRHLIINREMVGEDQFRRLTVFLRWAQDRGQLHSDEKDRLRRLLSG